MDDKSINLWRQVEGARRAGKRQAVNYARPGTEPARQGASN